MRELAIETTTHGRVLVEGPGDDARGLLVVFHGYGQNADEALEDARKIPGVAEWRLVVVQALHRFYTRNDQKVVANWMTRQDRELAIADNVAYVDRVVDVVGKPGTLVFAGFSQGVAMAFRAALLGTHRARGVIGLGGDIPPEFTKAEVTPRQPWPPVLLGAGTTEQWYTPKRVNADVAFLESEGIPHEVVRYEGGHEWTDEFRAAVGRWLTAR